MAGGTQQRAKSSKKGRKIDRNKAWCEGYRRAMKHEKSHIRRLVKHIATHQNDGAAKHTLAHFRSLTGIREAA